MAARLVAGESGRVILSTIAALVASVASAASAVAVQPRPTLRPCVVEGVDARCGTLAVPEDRARPAGRTIGLRVVVVPSLVKPARPDAFTYLAGGPGGAAASEMVSSALAIWPGVHERHDILLVDQRGTGGSNPLQCPPPAKPLATDAQRRQYARACLASLEGDPVLYGTRAAMDDLEAVRASLGYRSLDVYGTSYGATAAQVFLRRHPHSVRTLVLDGGTFIDVPFYSRYAQNGERALARIAARCAADRACARTFPHWRATLSRLIARWNAHPVRVGRAGKFSGDGLAGVVQGMTTTAATAAAIPLVVTRAGEGRVEPLAHYAGSPGTNGSMMYWSIMCNEPWVGMQSRGPWPGYLNGLTAATLTQLRTVCRYLPQRPERAADWRRPHSNVPLLVLAGGADPQDPIGNLPGLRNAFPRSRVVIARGQGHAVGQYGCLGGLVARFVDRGTVQGLDTTCVRDIPVPPFVLR